MKREPTPEQLTLITATAPVVCAIAGPGSGKTTTIIDRYAHFQDPHTWIVTFTNAAALELKHRIDDRNLPAPDFIGTLHSLAMRMIKRHLDPDMTLIDEESAEELMATVLKSLRSKLSTGKLRECLEDGGTTQPEKLAVMSYRARLRENKCEDYDTLLLTFRDLLTRTPIFVRRLMVDEYQDSGAVDHAIYAAIRAESKFIVGDPDQSIFGFRGGKIENLLSLSSTPGAFTSYLSRNFRCDHAITKAANALIRHNTQRLQKETVSQTGGVGTIAVADFESDGEELQGIVSICKQFPGTTAVLVRYNADRVRIANALAAAGQNVSEPEKKARPSDWPLAMTALALAGSPKNQILTMRFLVLSHGKVKAAEAAQAMLNQFGRLKAPTFEFGLREMMQTLNLSHATRGSLVRAYEAVRGGREDWKAVAAEMSVFLHHETAAVLPDPVERKLEVLTIHGSKGREFDNVVIPGLEAGALPGKAIEEDRRLMFVAITRARHNLFLGWSKRRLNLHSHKIEERTASRFLTEIGE